MKRRYWILALLPALCVLLLSACSKRTKNVSKPVGQEKASAAASIALTVYSTRYRAEYFSSDKLSIVSAAAADGGSVYLWGRNFQNEVEANWLIRYDPDKTAEESRLPLSEGGYITALDVSGGEAYYLERVDAEDGTAAWFFHAAQEAKRLDWANESNLFENLVVSGETAWFTDGETLYTVSLPDGAIVNTTHAETDITTILQKADRMIIAYCEGTGSLYELDGDALVKTGTLPLLFYNSKLLPGENSGFDSLVLGQAALFGWNITEETATQLLSFDTCGLVPNNISALAPLEGGAFVGAAWKSGELEAQLLSPEQFAETDALFDGELSYPGYPDAAGGCFYLNLPMAIAAAAGEKDGAWAFLKLLFSSAYYATRGGWIPLQSGFDASLQEALTNGASDKGIQRLADLQKNVHSLAYYDEAITSVIADETSYLFAGARTAERIDQRVQLYLTEQWG